MSEAGKRLIESAKQALEFVLGSADTDDYRIHNFEENNASDNHASTQPPVDAEQSIHVLRRDGGWAVRSEGSLRDTVIKPTQREAIQHATEIAKSQQTEVVIHGRDGRIRERKNYRSDTYPPNDKIS